MPESSFKLISCASPLPSVKSFKCFHLEEMPSAHFSVFARKHFLYRAQTWSCFFFPQSLKVSFFNIYIFCNFKGIENHPHQKLKLLHTSSIYIYLEVVLSNGCELRCNLVCGLSRLISLRTWWMRRGPTLRCISVTPDEIFHQSWVFPRLTAVLVNVFGIRLHTNLVKSNNLQTRFH